MWRSKENRCIADIEIRSTEIGAVETCISCPRCPAIDMIERISSGSPKKKRSKSTLMQFGKNRASDVIATQCIVFKRLKAAGENIKANKKFHRSLPR
jgi:hypothetical protein